MRRRALPATTIDMGLLTTQRFGYDLVPHGRSGGPPFILLDPRRW